MGNFLSLLLVEFLMFLDTVIKVSGIVIGIGVGLGILLACVSLFKLSPRKK
jgi:hypothetical protein